MITELPQESLLEAGWRYRGGNLVEQAGYTLELARSLGPQFEAALPEGLLRETENVRDRVAQALRDRGVTAAEARDSTRVQNDTLRRVREWMRKKSALGRMAARSGAAVPEPLSTIGPSVRSVPKAMEALERDLGLLGSNAKLFERFPLYDGVVGEGENLLFT